MPVPGQPSDQHRGCPVVAFDHNSPEHSADPVGSYKRLWEGAPIAWAEAQDGFWVLIGYPSVFDAARTDEVFSSARSDDGGSGLNNVIPKSPTRLHIPVELDPPEHRAYRKVLNPVTSPAAIATVQAMIDGWTTWFVEQVIESGEGNFASVIGVPAVVTPDWLGLDVADWQRYSRALHSVLADSPGSTAHTRSVTVDIAWMEERIMEAIAAWRAEPRGDLITYLMVQDADFHGFPMKKGDRSSSLGGRPTATRSSSRAPTRCGSTAGPPGTPRSAWACAGVPAPNSDARWRPPRSARCSSG